VLRPMEQNAMSHFVSFQHRLGKRLLVWSFINLVGGVLLQKASSPFWRAFGQQSIGWGAINAALAVLGRWNLRRKAARSASIEKMQRDVRNLQRILWINTGLDVLYIAGGWKLAHSRRKAKARGHGWGIVLQGAFLFFFDLLHAIWLHAIGLPRTSDAEGGEAK